jgi:hypothetical protein
LFPSDLPTKTLYAPDTDFYPEPTPVLTLHSLRFTLILSFHLFQGLPSDLFCSDIPTKIFTRFCSPQACCVAPPASSSFISSTVSGGYYMLSRVYTGPPGWSTRLNQWNWIQQLNDTLYTITQKWTSQSIPKRRQMNLYGKVLL